MKKGNKMDLKRKQRVLMQWKPAMSARFVVDEVRMGVWKVRGLGGLGGRQPGAESQYSKVPA